MIQRPAYIEKLRRWQDKNVIKVVTGVHFPKYLLTLDDSDPVSHEGVMQINALDWMLG